MSNESFSDMGRIAAIDKLFAGIEDKRNGSGAVAHRLLQEGPDFDLSYFPLKHLGYKAVVLVTGELYSRLAEAAGLSVVLGVSSKLDYGQIEELWTGVRVAAEEFGYKSLDLDLAPSINGLTVSLCATGEKNPSFGFSSPASKDLICVSGALGSAFLGQQVLENKAGELEKYRMMVADYLKPELREHTPSALSAAGITPTAGYFVTRGLADTLLRLKTDTGLGAKVYADKIPFEGNSFALGRELDIDPVSAAMNGGDDCRLLFTVPILQMELFRKEFPTYDIIGHLALPEAGACMVTPEGVELAVSAQGWNTEDE
ncbi:MAG: hypothetical protein MJY61_00205 [Bacteroidales bacterium]|nr:hypothetical protein [Bacteroidales bacterium]